MVMTRFLFLILFSLMSLRVSAATPSDIAPVVPSDADVVVSFNIGRLREHPEAKTTEVVQKSLTALERAGFNLETLSSVTVAAQYGQKRSALFLETSSSISSTVETLAKGTGATWDTGYVLEIPCIILNAPDTRLDLTHLTGFTALPALLSPTEKPQKLYLTRAKKGFLLLSDEKGFAWAAKPPKRMTTRSPMFAAVPTLSIQRALVWTAFTPSEKMIPALPGGLQLLPREHFEAAGAILSPEGSKRLSIQGRTTAATLADGNAMQAAIEMIVNNYILGFKDAALGESVKKAMTVKGSRTGCMLSFRFAPELLGKIRDAVVKLEAAAANASSETRPAREVNAPFGTPRRTSDS